MRNFSSLTLSTLAATGLLFGACGSDAAAPPGTILCPDGSRVSNPADCLNPNPTPNPTGQPQLETVTGNFDFRMTDPAMPQGGPATVTGNYDGSPLNFNAGAALRRNDPNLGGDVVMIQFLNSGGGALAGIFVVPISLYQAGTDITVNESLLSNPATATGAAFLLGDVDQTTGGFDPTGGAVSGTINFETAGTNIGDAVKGTFTVQVGSGGTGNECLDGCIGNTTPQCSQCFVDVNVCFSNSGCAASDQACIQGACGTEYDACFATGGACPPEFVTCVNGCQ